MTNAFEDAPVENVARGTVFSLLAIPVGIVAWVILWRFGFVASIVGFGVAFLAIALYRFGAGGVLGRQGAVRVAIVTIGTLLLAFAAGVVSDVLDFWSVQTGQDVIPALVSPEFWAQLQQILAIPGVASSYLPNFGLALLFGVLGCFQLLRSAFRASAAPAAPSVPPAAPDASTPFATPDAAGATPPPVAGTLPTPALPAPPVYPAPPTFPSPPDAVRPATPTTPARPGEFEEFRDPNYKP